MSQGYNTLGVPKSPSWMMRPRNAVLAPKRLSGPYRRQVSLEEAKAMNWFRVNPAILENNVYPTPAIISPLHHPIIPGPRQVVAKPFVAVALRKLEALLPAFLQSVTPATIPAVTAACTLLDTSLVNSNRNDSGSTDHNSRQRHKRLPSPIRRRKRRQQQQQQHRVTSHSTNILSQLLGMARFAPTSEGTLPNVSSSPQSPQRVFTSPPSSSSPSLSDGGNKSEESSLSASARALEEEWEQLVAVPLWLLAAAELLFADLYHLQPPRRPLPAQPSSSSSSSAYVNPVETEDEYLTPASIVKGLYQRTIQDFHRLQRVLCDPILAAAERETSSATTGLSSIGCQPTNPAGWVRLIPAARAVSDTLQTLETILSCRCQLLEIHATLVNIAPFHYQRHPQQHTPPNFSAFPQAATGMGLILHRLETTQETTIIPESIQPMFTTILRQVRGWKYAMEACLALEQCLFLETLFSLSQWKSCLPRTDGQNLIVEGDTCHALWMTESFRRVVTLLPIFFDKIEAFATPLYGFNTSSGSPLKLGSIIEDGDYSDLENHIVEFLRRQEKLSGPPTAVAIILDAAGTSNYHIERGFRLSLDVTGVAENDVRNRWPAVFLRSTAYFASGKLQLNHTTSRTMSSSSSSLASGVVTRGQASLNSLPSSPITRLGSRKSVLGVSAATLSNPSIRTKTQLYTPNPDFSALLEYGPDEGNATQWPHSDWEVLAKLLDQNVHSFLEDELADQSKAKIMKLPDESEDPDIHKKGPAVAGEDNAVIPTMMLQFPEAVTYSDAEDVGQDDGSETYATISTHSSATALFHMHIPQAASSPNTLSLAKAIGKIRKGSSSFHMISLSSWTTMVVLVKKDEISKNSRRRHSLSNTEIQDFLRVMASKLRLPALFSAENLPPSKIPVNGTGQHILAALLPLQRMHRDTNPWSTDEQLHLFLRSVKEGLGLRPISSPETTGRSWWFFSSLTDTVRPRDEVTNQSITVHQALQNSTERLSESAVSFFIGSELRQYFAD